MATPSLQPDPLMSDIGPHLIAVRGYHAVLSNMGARPEWLGCGYIDTPGDAVDVAVDHGYIVNSVSPAVSRMFRLDKHRSHVELTTWVLTARARA